MRSNLRLPDGTVDLLGAVVERSTGSHALSPLEVAALSVLAEAAPAPVTEAELLQKAWGYRTTNTRTVSVAMSRLRKKLEQDPRVPTVLLTVRGVGYQLQVDALEAPAHDEAPLPRAPIGRTDAIERARQALQRDRAVELVGPGGIGKSTLARALAPRPVWVDLDGVRDPTSMWRRLVGAFDAGSEDPREAVRRLWSAHGGVLVLDGCEQLEPEAVAELKSLCRHTASGQVVVTSRRPLGVAPTVLVEPVSRESALAILAELRRNSGLPPLQDARVEALLERLGGHPLALVLAAPLLDMGVSTDELLELRDEGLAHTLRGVLEQTVAQLPDRQRALIAVASCFVDPPDVPVLAQVLDLPTVPILRDVQYLRASGLLTVQGRHLHVHPFIREVTTSDAATALYRSWAARLESAPNHLARRRNEIENALQGASGSDLFDLLVRHVLVLDHQGPKDGMLTDVETALAAAPDDPRSDAVRAIALLSLGANQRALPLVERALDAFAVDGDDAGLWWRGYAVVAWEYAVYPNPGTPEAHHYQDLLEAVRPRVREPYLWSLLTLRLAWLRPDRAAALRREVIARDDLSDGPLTARVHQAWQEQASLPELDAIEHDLNAAGPSTFTSQGWGILWCFLVRTRLANGDIDGAMERFRRLPERFALLDPRGAATQAYLIAILLSRHPALADEVAATLDPGPRAEVLRWLQDPVGEPPTDENVDQFRAWRDGEPLPGPIGAVHVELSRMLPAP